MGDSDMRDPVFMLDDPEPCFICDHPTRRVDLHYGAPFCGSSACERFLAAELADGD